MNKNEMESWLKELADIWPSHEDSVQEKIARIVEDDAVDGRNPQYYLGYIQGMLACTERIKGVLDSMDNDKRALYYSIMKYCAFKYCNEQDKQ